MGWCLRTSPGGINCYRWKRWCRDAGEPSLEKLCTGARSALGRSLQRDSAPSTSHVPTLSWAGYTEGHNSQNKRSKDHGANGQKLKSSSPGLRSGSERVPSTGKPPSSPLGSLKKQHQLHAQLKIQRLFPKYPPFPAGKWPRLLCPPPPPPPGLVSRCSRGAGSAASCAPRPRNHEPERRSDGTRGGKQRWRAEDDDASPHSFVFLDLPGVLVGSFAVSTPHLQTSARSERGTRGWAVPARALAGCYLLSRDSRYSSAMS